MCSYIFPAFVTASIYEYCLANVYKSRLIILLHRRVHALLHVVVFVVFQKKIHQNISFEGKRCRELSIESVYKYIKLESESEVATPARSSYRPSNTIKGIFNFECLRLCTANLIPRLVLFEIKTQ